MTEVNDDSNKLTKLIMDLQQVYNNTKEETQKLVILDRILKALYDTEFDHLSIPKSNRSEITWWQEDNRQDHSGETSSRRSS